MLSKIIKSGHPFYIILILILDTLFFFRLAYSESKEIKVGYYDVPHFQEYDNITHEYSGYDYEYLLAIQNILNKKFVFVHATYHDCLKMLKNGEIDVMNGVYKDSNTISLFDFVDAPDLIIHLDLVTNSKVKNISINDFSHDKIYKIGTLDVFGDVEDIKAFFHQKNINVNINVYTNINELRDAFQRKDIDFYILTDHMHTDELIVAHIMEKESYLAVTQNKKGLITDLNIAIALLRHTQPNISNLLLSKYLNKKLPHPFVLTDAEKNFVTKHKTVTVSYDPDRAPISYRDSNGEFNGRLLGLYTLISQKTGLNFKFVASDTFEGALDNFKSGKTELLAAIP